VVKFQRNADDVESAGRTEASDYNLAMSRSARTLSVTVQREAAQRTSIPGRLVEALQAVHADLVFPFAG
jgi:hypothetical protein